MEKKFGDVDKKITDVSGLVTTTILNTKFAEVYNKRPGFSGSGTATVLDTKKQKLRIRSVFDLIKKKQIVNVKYQTLESNF